MCRAPSTIVFLAAFLGAPSSAPAHKISSKQSSSSVSATEAPVEEERFQTNKPALSNAVLVPTPTVSSQKITSAYRGTDRVVAAPSPSHSPSFNGRSDTGWRYIAALLGTLAIIGTIAARRYSAEKHQA